MDNLNFLLKALMPISCRSLLEVAKFNLIPRIAKKIIVRYNQWNSKDRSDAEVEK